MATTAAVLDILIKAQTAQASSSLTKFDAQLRGTAARSNGLTRAASAAAARTTQIAKTAVVGAGVVGVASAKMALDFENSLQKVHNLVGSSQKQVDKWGEQLLALAPRVGKSPQELADALYFVSSSGIKTSKVLETVKVSAQASALGLGDTATVADALTSAMNAYAKSGLNAKDATNVLIETVKFGKLESDALAQSIGRVIPVASKLGVPFEDVGASLASMSLQGLDAAESTTALRAIFTATLKPTNDAEKALASVGLSAEELRTSLKERGTLATLELLSKRFKGNEEQIARVFPNVRALVGAFNLTGDSAKRNEQIFADMKKGTDELGKSWKDFKQTPAQQLRSAIAGIEAQMTKLGIRILPVAANAFKDVVDVVTDPKLTDQEKLTKLVQMASDAIAKLVPKAIDVGVDVGKGLIGGIAQAWRESNVLQKLIIGAGLIRLVGGPGALLGTGKLLGRYLGVGMATSTVSTAAGGSGAGAGAAAGGIAGGIGSKLSSGLKVAGKVGGIALGAALLDMTISEFGRQSQLKSGDWAAELNAGQGPKPLGIDVFGGLSKVPGFGSMLKDSEKQSRTLKETLDGLAASTRRISGPTAAYIDQLSRESGMTDEARRSLQQYLAQGKGFARWRDQFRAIADDSTIRKLHNSFDFLRSGTAASLKDVNRVVSDNTKIIGQTMGMRSKQGRQAMAEQFHLAVGAIRDAMKRGDISTKQGMARIHDLIHKANLLDPTRKQAQMFGREWAKGLDKSKDVTRSGVAKLIDNLGKLPPAARTIAARTALNHLQQAKREGDITKRQYDKMRSQILSTYTDIQVGGNRKTAKMAGQVAANVISMVRAVTGGYSILGQNTTNMLKTFGAKALKFTLKNPGKVGSALGTVAGILGAQRGASFTVPGAGVGDKVPLHLAGKHVADVEPKEVISVTNREAAKRLAAQNAMYPRYGMQGGGMVDRTGVMHFAKGGGMAAMVAEANKFEAKHFPYLWGGGHGGFGIHPVDCSGAVSDVLHAGGLLNAPMVSGALMGWGKAGKGPLTVYASPHHTVMSLGGKFFGTSDSNPGGGAGWIEGGSPALVSGGVARTMDVAGGIIGKLKRLILEGPDGPLKKGGQGALDKAWHAANAYISKHMPAGRFGGGDAQLLGALKGGRVVGASDYGPPNAGTVGYRGDSLPGKMAYAELGMGSALGGLPYRQKLQIGYHGKSVIGEKLDIGAGGGPVKGHPREIDLWVDTAKALGFPVWGLDLVQVKKLMEGGMLDASGMPLNLAEGGGIGVGRTLGAIRKHEHAKKPLKKLLERIKDLGIGEHLQNRMKRLTGSAGDYEELADRASQLSGDSFGGASTAKVLGHTEAEWLQKALTDLFKLRNALLHAHNQLERQRKRVEDSLKKAKKKVDELQRSIKHNDNFKTHLQHQLDAEQKKPQGKQDAAKIKRLKKALSEHKAWPRELAALKDKIVPALTGEKSKLKGKDSNLRSALEEVQGRASSMKPMGHLPTVGTLGGRILDAQIRLRELGKTGQANDDQVAITQSFFDFLKLVGPGFAGPFSKGGVVGNPWALVGEKGPELTQLPVGTRVHSATDSASMLAPVVSVEVRVKGSIVSDEDDPVEVLVNDRRFAAKVNEIGDHRERGKRRRDRQGVSPTR